MKTENFSDFVGKLLEKREIAREYYRVAPFYNLADQLILLRKKRGMTQGELAKKADTTQAVISRLENASVHCSLETVVKLAEALDAIVEVNLVPREEKERKESADTNEEKDCAETEKSAQEKGKFYFGANNVSCFNAFPYAPAAGFSRIPDPSNPVSKKKKQLEIA